MRICAISLLVFMFMPLLSAQRLRLKFESSSYALRDGSAFVLSAEILYTPASSRLDDPSLVPLVNGFIEPSSGLTSGQYVAVLDDVTLIRLADNAPFRIARMNVGPFLVTESDVQTGSATVNVDIPGLYRITVVGSSGRTVPNSRISLQNSVDHVLELTTNAGGQATLVGKIENLMHAVSLDATDQHVKIEPL